MKLSEIVKAANYKIKEGCEFLWDCYGENSRTLDFGGDDAESVVSCVFDSGKDIVFQVEIYSKDGKVYRWVDPEYQETLKNEFQNRGLSYDYAYDDVMWFDLEHTNDVFIKTKQIIETGICDDKVTILLEIQSQEDYDKLQQLSIQKGINIKDVVAEFLEAHCKEHLNKQKM